MKTKIYSVIVNYFVDSCGRPIFEKYTTGSLGVKEIIYFETKNEHFCDVLCENGDKFRIFNINKIEYTAPKENVNE